MASFLTQCPHCITSFRVSDTQLEAAGGRVRCGACLGVFSAEANRITIRQRPNPEELDADLFAGDDEDEAEAEEEGRAPVTAAGPAPLFTDHADDDDDEFQDTEDWAESRLDFDVPLGDLDLDGSREEPAFDDEDDEDDDDDDDDEEFREEADDLLDEAETDGEFDDEIDEDLAEEAVLVEDEAEEDEDFPVEEADEDFAAEDMDDAEELGACDEEYAIVEEYTDEDVVAANDEDEREEEANALLAAANEDVFDPEEDDDGEFVPPLLAADGEAEADDFDDEVEAVRTASYDEEEDDFEEDESDHEFYGDADEDEGDAEEPGDEVEEEDDDDEDIRMPPHGRRPESPSQQKRVYRDYLAQLEDDEGLGPLQPGAALGDFADEPVMLDSRNSTRRGLKVIGLFLLNLVLFGVLGLQYINSNIERFVASPRYAAIMPAVCRVLECPPPAPAPLGNLQSQDLLVRSHPRFADALEVSFIFRNDGPTAQPFPAIELGFSDSANRPIANRLFQPAEYLAPELQRMREMPPQSSLQVMLEMKDPGSEAVNYTLEFRQPGI